METPFERNYHARQIKNFRKILRGSEPEIDLPPSNNVIERILRIALYIGISICMVLMLHGCAWCSEIPQEKAIQTILGEASNQGFIGMVAVGEVIRQNGTLKGFYGFNAMNHRKEPAWAWALARKAWLASKSTNYTHHADHFENLKLDTPYWVKDCVLTFQYKDHLFFREVKS